MDSKSICASCTRNCDSSYKTELAMKGCISNIYLRKGPKITYACKLYSAQKNASPILNSPYVESKVSVSPSMSRHQFQLPDLRVV